MLNTAIGFWMEYQAQQSMEALKKMDKVTTNVLRNGEKKTIEAEKVVPGDILLLEPGMLISADVRLTEVSELEVDESPMTGESVPVQKKTNAVEENALVADRTNMGYKGTAVTNGSAKAVVVATGMRTELGSISRMVSEEETSKVPLDKKLGKLTHILIYVILGLAALYFLFGWVSGKELYQLIQTAIAWAIAAIPEGLPIVASIALAKGMLRLARHNVIVKRLSAVETLGETTVIMTDKTGTLTENKLTVNTIELPDHKIEVGASDSSDRPDWKDNIPDSGNKSLHKLFTIGILCNNASLADKNKKNGDDSKNSNGGGDPVEVALLEYGRRFNKEGYEQLKNAERVREDPFDSETMVMGTIHSTDDKFFIAAKGATEAILKRSDKIMKGDGAQDFNDEEKKKWQEKDNDLAEDGLRVLAFAYREENSEPSEEEFVQHMVFVGLIGFLDPPRRDVTEAIETCRQAGIKVEMVTGDHPGTALNIAQKVKLVDHDSGKQVMHGQDVPDEPNEDHHDEIFNTTVFARVNPKQKLDIIDFYQKNGEIVGMTGDGVNDAPALKKANIGIAMGKRGTQVAKEVADMVLKDDAFPSIVEAVKEGRIIFGNIRKFIIYQLSYHLSEIIVIASISFTIFYLPLLPLQLLFLNLLSDVFPALALGIGKGDESVMQQPPKDPKEAVINRKNWFDIVLYGFVIAIFVIGAYFFSMYKWGLSKEICNNVAFFSLAFAQLWHVLDMRENNEKLFVNQVTSNKYIWMALAFCSGVLLAAYFTPFVARILSFQQLEWKVWMLIAITSVLPVVVIQLIKEVSYRIKGK